MSDENTVAPPDPGVTLLLEQVAVLERELAQSRGLARFADEALSRAQEELRKLRFALLVAQEEERRRIARELHDDLSQRLAALAMRLAVLRRTAPGTELAHAELLVLEGEVAELSNTVRRLSHGLHPSILEDLGLPTALERHVEQFRAHWGASVIFELRGPPPTPSLDTALVLYRIAQEALRNVTKHAKIGPVVVTLTVGAGELCLTVQDSGPGFEPAENRHRGLGLTSMQERAQLLRGTLELRSGRGLGTTLLVRIPDDPGLSDGANGSNGSNGS